MSSSDGSRAGVRDHRPAFMKSGIINELKTFLKLQESEWSRHLLAAGLTPEDLEHDEGLIPLDKGFTAFDVLARGCGRPEMGFEFASAFEVGGTGPLGFAIVNAKTVRTAMQTIARFIPMIVSMRFSRYEEDHNAGSIIWQYVATGNAPRLHFNTWGVAIIALRLAGAMPAGWKPKAVLIDAEPPSDTSKLVANFGPSLEIRPGHNRLQVQASLLDRPMPAANPRLFALMTRLAEADRQRLGVHGSTFETDVRAAISGLLSEGKTDARALAEQMGMPIARLRREMKLHGLDVRSLLNDVRKTTAHARLTETDLTITEIAFSLGYSDSSLFTRACRNWFEMPPREVRKQAQRRK